MNDKIKREKEYHNRRFKEGATFRRKRLISPFYLIHNRTFKAYQDLLFNYTQNKPVRVLEYGCGEGSYSFTLAQQGADVFGIDISEVAISNAIQKSRKNGYDGTIEFKVMNAEHLEFEKNTFDIICGSAILHHLDLEKAYQQIYQVLRPGGVAIFLEPLAHNLFINLYRRLTPGIRTPDEHPLFMEDIWLANKYFSKIYIEYYQLITLMAVPFFKFSCFPTLLSLFEKIEIKLFKDIPSIRQFAWSTIIVFVK